MVNKGDLARLEAQQPFLLETIVNLAMYGSAAEDKRRDDRYRSMMTLNDLKAALENDGFEVSSFVHSTFAT